MWGGKTPKFKDLDEMNRIMALVLAYYNDIVQWFEQQPEAFQPTFYESKIEGKRVFIVDEWCFGFLKGVRLDTAELKPLKKERPDLLRPIQLFGSHAGWKQLRAGDPVTLHKQWSPKVAPAARAIYQFWIPYREAPFSERAAGTKH